MLLDGSQLGGRLLGMGVRTRGPATAGRGAGPQTAAGDRRRARGSPRQWQQAQRQLFSWRSIRPVARTSRTTRPDRFTPGEGGASGWVLHQW